MLITLLGSLMRHSSTTANLDPYSTFIQYIKANFPNVAFVLGESASSYNPVCGNDYQLEAVLGAALWRVDYLLYAMSIVS